MNSDRRPVESFGIDPSRLPRHVAIIMDGNGRWAKQKLLNRIRGHERGAETVRDIVRASREIGVRCLTLYAFSTENWERPKHEVAALMDLLKRFLRSEKDELLENGIRLQAIGQIHRLPRDVQDALEATVEATAGKKDMTLNLALSYGGREEIVYAARQLARKVEAGQLKPDAITEETITNCLYTAGMDEPDLLIRTSGEMRISNFLLWQIAYCELYVTPTLWPDFGRKEYLKILSDFQDRERRFGRTRSD
ncbi:isoprenyl transferase [Thermodesulfobacteriota bacterium]